MNKKNCNQENKANINEEAFDMVPKKQCIHETTEIEEGVECAGQIARYEVCTSCKIIVKQLPNKERKISRMTKREERLNKINALLEMFQTVTYNGDNNSCLKDSPESVRLVDSIRDFIIELRYHEPEKKEQKFFDDINRNVAIVHEQLRTCKSSYHGLFKAKLHNILEALNDKYEASNN